MPMKTESMLFISYKSFCSNTSRNKIKRKLFETLKGRTGSVTITYAAFDCIIGENPDALTLKETYEDIWENDCTDVIDEVMICFDLGANMFSFYYEDGEFLFSICITGVDKNRYKKYK